MYRAGIIGYGWIGCGISDFTKEIKEDTHMRAYQDCPDTELVTICDTNSRRLFAIPLLNYRLWSDYKGMVQSETLDIVSVCTPVETHCQIVCDIAPYVKAIYCEKPIATTLDEADKMIETCHKHNVILQVNHQRRFMPVKVRFSRDIIDTGTHMFDRLRQLFGEFEGSSGNLYLFGNQWVEIEYIKSDERIFEIDCVCSKERMILKGVEHLVWCLEEKHQSISSGEEARKTLDVVLAFKESYENSRRDFRKWDVI